MFNSVQEAIDIINHQGTSPNDYRLACEYLIKNREKLQQRVFICLPGGLRGNNDSMWDAVKVGSEERCSCGNERVIVPLNPRTQFRAASQQIVIVPEKPVYLKPIGGDKTSALIRLEIQQEALTFLEDPFAPFILTLDIFQTKGYRLQQLADVLRSQTEPPVLTREFAGTPTPIFAVNAVDTQSNSVTITPDIAIEAFDPDEMPDHNCA